jgi:hypothetical protein
MNNANSNHEDFTRRKFLTGITRGLVASAVVAGNANVVDGASGKESDPTNDEQIKQEVKLAPLYAASEQSSGRPPLPYSPEQTSRARNYDFLVGSFFCLVFAKSSSCFADMDLAISFDAPFKLDFGFSPRLAAKAEPAAICCFFDFAGIQSNRRVLNGRIYTADRL